MSSSKTNGEKDQAKASHLRALPKDEGQAQPQDSAPETTSLALHKLIPNILTLTALLSGLTAIQMAINGRYEFAAILILIAAILDALDGATARLLNAGSEFGAQLDSLSDFLCFGVAPAFILYVWGLDEIGRLGWIATLIYGASCALRLARYNVTSHQADDKPEWARLFFQGVPAPAAAGLALFPMFMSFQAPDTFAELNVALPLIGIWVIVVAALMVSRFPTWSSKQLKMRQGMTVPVLALVCFTAASLIHAPWLTLSVVSVIYMISIPLTFRYYRKMEREYGTGEADLTDLAIGAGDD